MNKHVDRLLNAFKPGPRPHMLVKQMMQEQERWNDLFSTKLIEALEKIAALQAARAGHDPSSGGFGHVLSPLCCVVSVHSSSP